MRISAVGSFANIITAIVFINILFLIIIPSYGDGLIVEGVINETPAYGKLEEGMIIYEVNNKSAKNRFLFEIEPDQNITLNTSNGAVVIETIPHPDDPQRGYLGIFFIEYTKSPITPDVFMFIVEVFFWIYFLNIAVGLVNLLPVLPLDGGRMFSELIDMFKLDENTANNIIYAVIVIILATLLINASPLLNMLIKWLGQGL